MSVDPKVAPKPRGPGRPFRLFGRSSLIGLAVVAIVVLYATGQIAPAASDREAQERVQLAAQAGGSLALVLLAIQVSLGFVLSHPTGTSTWNVSKRLFPWHTHLWVFVIAFLLVHIASIVLDRYAKVTIIGAFIPGLSAYRIWPVALGTIALYAFLVTALTAGYTNLVPAGVWLTIHRVSVVVFVLAWLHVQLIGSESDDLSRLYVVTGVVVVGSGLYRLWASRQGRPTFLARLREASGG
jgi:sulfoxide reductase heme-binding subunit YedZ